MRSVAVVGASLAGFHAARTLRKEGFDGRLTVIGAEPHRPYDRPPLSKQFLAGGEDKLLDLPGTADLEDLALDWRLGSPASGLDIASHTVSLANGERVAADGVVIATGGVVRTLPAFDGWTGVHVLRTVDDARALRADLDGTPSRVVVIGAGFIGAEVAATCRARGLEVTIIEVAPVPFVPSVGATVGSVLADLQRDHGVDVRLATGVDAVEGGGRVERLKLTDGSVLAADVVVVGVGVRPSVDWLEGSGLRLDNGVVCDATCLAAPGIVAAGDVARWPNAAFDGELMRVEHWENAIAMGSYAAKRLLVGDGWVEQPYNPVPWFWSDQFDRKIQFAGRAHPEDSVEIVAGTTEERRFAALYGRAGRLVGVLGMNRPRQVMQFRGLIERQASFAEALELARAAT